MDRFHRKLVKERHLTMLFIVIFIFADILCANFIGIVSDSQPRMQPTLFFLGFGLLQIFCAPLQSGISDHIGRKKSLIISLSFSLLSLLAVLLFQNAAPYLFFLVLAILLKGALGNTLPISLAVMADIQNRNYRIYFACSTGAYALAYLLLALTQDKVSEVHLNYLLSIVFLLILTFCIRKISDSRDKNSKVEKKVTCSSVIHSAKNEASSVLCDLKLTSMRKALSAFFLWELSLYSILLTQVDFRMNKINHIAESMMYGYLLGVLTLFFCEKIQDKKIIRIGYLISFFSLTPYFILHNIIEDQTSLIRFCYFFHALGNAFLSPAFLSILAKEKKIHERGRTYGLTDSVDTCGYLIAALVIMLINYFNLSTFHLILFSFVTFSFSWGYYNRFQGSREANE